MPGLYRVIYTSKVCDRAFDLPDVMDDIATSCRRNNFRLGLTGALFFTDTLFAQILEGDEPSVRHVMNCIQSDDRHEDLEVLFNDEIPARWFGNWSMAFVALAECADIPGLARRYDIAGSSRDEVLALLRRLVTTSGEDGDQAASIGSDVGHLCAVIGKLRPNVS